MSASSAVSEAGFAALQVGRLDAAISSVHLSSEYREMVAGVRTVFDSGRTKDLEWRRQQLQNLIRAIQENHEAVRDAVHSDLGGPKIRAIFEMGLPINDCEKALENLITWTKPQVMRNDIPVDFQSTYQVRPEPKGVVLNIAPWNAPFLMCFQPMIPAIAAGNCIVIKPSEMAPACASVIEMMVNKYLDTDCIKIVQGAVAETQALLEQRWDHIFYTGNGVVGRVVARAAAENLTPITLELGGKSPVLVDKTANMATVVNRVFAAKYTNCGQICVAPDYVLVDACREQELVDALSKQVAASGFGVGSKSNPNWGKIINRRHCDRLKRLIETSGGEVVCGGADDVDSEARHVPFTILRNVNRDAPILFEEIFGPILPIIPVNSMQEAVEFVKSREHPLALYIYSQDKVFTEKVLSECTSGGAGVNDSLGQLMNKEAPFGGTGSSGIGKYHGKYGFDEFSHIRTVLYKSGSSPTVPHPEAQPEWLYDVALKALVTGFLTPEQKRTVKFAGATALAAAGALAMRSRL